MYELLLITDPNYNYKDLKEYLLKIGLSFMVEPILTNNNIMLKHGNLKLIGEQVIKNYIGVVIRRISQHD